MDQRVAIISPEKKGLVSVEPINGARNRLFAKDESLQAGENQWAGSADFGERTNAYRGVG